MNYELAKQLKEAGFPNIREIISKDIDVKMVNLEVIGQFEKENIIGYEMPTLSELIEACGECLSHIKRLPVGGKEYWWAVSNCGHPEHEWGGNNLEEQGSTPEEAVAKLWLELNKK